MSISQSSIKNNSNQNKINRLYLIQRIQQMERKQSLSTKKKKQLVGYSSGEWTLRQMKLYHRYLSSHQNQFTDPILRKRNKVFIKLADFIGSRTPDQCRSHHQKVTKKFPLFHDLLQHYQQKIQNLQKLFQKICQNQPNEHQIIHQNIQNNQQINQNYQSNKKIHQEHQNNSPFYEEQQRNQPFYKDQQRNHQFIEDQQKNMDISNGNIDQQIFPNKNQNTFYSPKNSQFFLKNRNQQISLFRPNQNVYKKNVQKKEQHQKQRYFYSDKKQSKRQIKRQDLNEAIVFGSECRLIEKKEKVTGQIDSRNFYRFQMDEEDNLAAIEIDGSYVAEYTSGQ